MAMGTDAFKGGAPKTGAGAPGERQGDVVAMVSLNADGTPRQSANFQVWVPEHARPEPELKANPDLARAIGARGAPEPEPVAASVADKPAGKP